MNLNLCFPYIYSKALQSKVYLYCPVKSVCISQLVCSHFIDCDMILCNVCLLWCGVWLCCGCVHSGNNNNNIMSTQQHNLMHFYWFLLKLGIKNQGQSQNGNDMQDIFDKLWLEFVYPCWGWFYLFQFVESALQILMSWGPLITMSSGQTLTMHNCSLINQWQNTFYMSPDHQ